MENEDYVKALFKKSFINNQKELAPTVIYGLGEYTKVILAEFPDYPFLGILDGFRNSGVIYGKPILKLEDIEALNCQIIVIARPGSQKLIMERIGGFCELHKIPVYNLEKENLLRKKAVIWNHHPYFQIGEEDLKRYIDRYENISFDLFDTLFVRKTVWPEDVFELVQLEHGTVDFDFVHERIMAEKKLSVEKVPGIHEIYQTIGYHNPVAGNVIEELKNLEIELETESLVQRKRMADFFHYAISREKNVYLISDMYLPKDILISILNKMGICGYKEIFISCEYGTDKGHRLFDVYRKEAANGTCLHIGNDEDSDGAAPQRKGIDSFLIKSPADMLEVSRLHELTEGKKQGMGKWELGLYLASAFNNPFCLFRSEGKIPLDSPYDYGYQYLAPVLTEFILWLVKAAREEQFNRILFISRDGYCLRQMYEYIRKRMLRKQVILPEADYLKTSRTLCMASAIWGKEDIIYAAGLPFDGTPEELLEKRFHIKDIIDKYDEDKFSTCSDYILYHENEIYEKSQELRVNYEKHLKKLNIKPEDKVAIFDFVSTGTCQMCLERLLGKAMTGVYFSGVHDNYHRKKSLRIRSFVQENQLGDAVDNYFWMENMIKEPGGSVLRFDSNGGVIYCDETRGKKQLTAIKAVQKGIMEYLRIFIDSVPMDAWQDRGIGIKLYNYANKEYLNFGVDEFQGCLLKDEFCNRTISVAP